MSARASRRATRGLTLIELMVALTVSTLTIAAAMTMLIQQQRAYTVTSGDRAQQEAGRMALREITRRLRIAGYGVDSNLVLDFGSTPIVPRSNLIDPATAVAFTRWACTADVTCRDSVDGSRSDELVFLTRDPLFSRVASSVSTSSFKLLGDLKQPMYAGQLLQVSCMGGTKSRAYVTVQRDITPPATPLATNLVQVDLQPGNAVGGLLEFGHENATLADGCFTLATAGQQPIVTIVDRSRFYVDWYDPKGNTVAPQTLGSRPYLMLDRGLAGGGATPLPVAGDVEDLQLTYLFGPAAAGGPQRVVGATPGVSIAADPTLPVTTAVSPPAYDDAPDAASRITGHPANINGIIISVVVRTTESDAALVSDADRTLPKAGNRAAFLGEPGYKRSLFETTVFLRNLQTVSFVYPTVNAAGGTGFNVGGG